jgi:hypothetical protein
MLSSGANVIIWKKMISSGANVIMVSSGANVIIWCYHVMLSSGMITHPFFIFPENFTHSYYTEDFSVFFIAVTQRIKSPPEPIVGKEFLPKERSEKVMSSCSINLPHLPYSHKHFPPIPSFVHRVEA